VKNKSTEVLLVIRRNMLDSLPRIQAMMEDGTLYIAKHAKACPPLAGAGVTALLLTMVEEELTARGVLA
jgi:hypothetical protein